MVVVKPSDRPEWEFPAANHFYNRAGVLTLLTKRWWGKPVAIFKPGEWDYALTCDHTVVYEKQVDDLVIEMNRLRVLVDGQARELCDAKRAIKFPEIRPIRDEERIDENPDHRHE